VTETTAFDGWALDPGTLGFDVAFPRYLEAAGRAGYDWVEVPVGALLELGPRRLRELCARSGVEPGLYSCPWELPANASVPDEVFDRRMRALPAVLSKVAEAGGRRIGVYFNGGQPHMQRLSFEELVDRCGRLAVAARREGLQLCLELNDVEHLRAATRVLAAVGDGSTAALLLDTFHWFRAELTLEWLEGLSAGAVGWLHVSDVVPGTPSGVNDAPRVAPGRGMLDLGGFLRAAAARGYRGPVSIEVLPPPRDPADIDGTAASLLADARAAAAALRLRVERASPTTRSRRSG